MKRRMGRLAMRVEGDWWVAVGAALTEIKKLGGE